MRILEEVGLTFDDLLIVPQFSGVNSRANVDISTVIGRLKLDIPLIAANMDTICDVTMAEEMGNLGGMGILHRFAPFGEQLDWVRYLKNKGLPAVPSVGVGPEDAHRALMFLENGADMVCIDVAHGNHLKVATLTTAICAQYTGYHVIVGNFAAVPDGEFLNDGITIKVGIGPGSACETRTVAGVGVPQATAIVNVSDGFNTIADGGIRKPADFAKAIGLGADAAMIGGYFAGTNEVPARGKTTFRGMASRDAQLEHRGSVSNSIAEGASFDVESRGPVKDRVEQLLGGLRSAMSYTGARTIREFQRHVVFQRVSQATLSENIAHFGR